MAPLTDANGQVDEDVLDPRGRGSEPNVQFLPTDDPAVKVSNHTPHPICDVFGHSWHMFQYPFTMVFNPETGQHLMDTYRAICRRCPVTVLVERKVDPLAGSSAVERGPVKPVVEGSNPSPPATSCDPFCDPNCELCDEW